MTVDNMERFANFIARMRGNPYEKYNKCKAFIEKYDEDILAQSEKFQAARRESPRYIKRQELENAVVNGEMNWQGWSGGDRGGGRNPKNCKKTGIKKVILGKERCIYKMPKDKKEYLKYKGALITVAKFKSMKVAKAKAKAKKPKKRATKKRVGGWM
jgi:hypothetical protein